ncbi:MAG: 50S ribosomal protein L10 [Chloroflexi bacterium]|nr:50S ribosomal protein L10 [Chloroflexota bacterium]
MPKEKKVQTVSKLQEIFARSTVGILTDYRGLTMAEMTALRRKLQAAGGDYKVVKNTLARLAATNTNKEALGKSLEGPVAIAFGFSDIVAPSQVLTGYIEDTKANIKIKGGFLGDRLLTPQEAVALATIPPREVLIAQMLGQMKSPISHLVGCLTAPMRGLVGVLQARSKQLEGA